MQGYAYTIFAGDQIEKFDLEVIGVMPNFLGPRQSIILVQLKGPKVEHTGVVAGMSGSPVYLDGKLAGALSLKLGVFTKEAIAGVTPIEDVMHPEVNGNAQPVDSRNNWRCRTKPLRARACLPVPRWSRLPRRWCSPDFSPPRCSNLRRKFRATDSWRRRAAQSAPRPDDAHLAPGDMAGMVLVRGDASINSACTVTAVQADRVFLCGHPFLSLGDVQLPMARSRVVTTLASELASTKIVNVGGSIGTIVGDHLTAVTGKLGRTSGDDSARP